MGIAVVLVFGVWWLISPAPAMVPVAPAVAAVAVTSPAGGTEWQTGETRTITWTTTSIAETDRVSVTIRRLPPPSLSEEGQEFDPVVFVDLPNTGAVDWEIHPMYPTGTYVLELHVYESLPMTESVSAESEPFTIVNTNSPTGLNTDLYPLYSNTEWSESATGEVTVGDTTLRGTAVFSEVIAADMNPAAVFQPFEEYYANLLGSLGWEADSNLAAGGSTGGQTGYSRDGETILLRYRIDYEVQSENAPPECPCDVTLSLFSTTE